MNPESMQSGWALCIGIYFESELFVCAGCPTNLDGPRSLEILLNGL